jgi:phytol kinase
MIAVFLSLVAIFLILVISEVLWNHKKLNGELGRKFVHITVGSFVAFWPFYMSFRTIQLISIAFLIVVLAARYLKIFHAVHVANRKTWGDLTFAIGIGLTATIAQVGWFFTIAILSMSLADGLAGIIGSRYGKSNSYLVLGYKKSVIGSLTFWLVTLLIFVVTQKVGGITMPVGTVIILPLAATAIENLGILGLDNILVPVMITLALGRLL